MPATRYPLLATLLRRYFYSGWAFHIPYLAAYLLYYLTGWAVNPPADTGSLTHSPSPFAPPPLLHLYWSLHAIHLTLAALALRSWWTENYAQYVRSASDSHSVPYSSYRLHLLTRIAPWAILALIFYIPGVYLEWPSDPWEHLRRINEWRILDTVGAHSSWHKSSYFIPYSFLSWCTGLRQLFWLDFYYTGICLLLCWQYYRFARACGLGERASMVFVILQALLFGNNIFSFYRYYGISSSIYAQLGAIALTRIVLEFAARGTNAEPRLSRDTKASTNPDTPSAHGLPSAPPSYSLLTTRYSLLTFSSRSTFWHLPSLFWLLASGLCLLVLIAFNHPQGLGIAALGIIAVIVWRLIEWKRSMLAWLIGGALLINALFLALYHRPAIIETYRAQGYLNAWYGFNILDLTSPAGDRMLQITDITGLINTAAAIFLFRRTQIISCLTIMPLIALLMPCFVIPFATIANYIGGTSNIITFHRLLLASPYVLALAALFQFQPKLLNQLPLRHLGAFCGMLIISVFVLIASGAGNYNRFWHALSLPPHDFTFKYVLTEENYLFTRAEITRDIRVVGTRAWLGALSALAPVKVDRLLRTQTTATSTYLNDHYSTIFNGSILTPSTLLPYTAKEPQDRAEYSFAQWTTLRGPPPTLLQVADPLRGSLEVLQSGPGVACDTFCDTLFPISLNHVYKLEIQIKQLVGPASTVLPAVAWYDSKGQFLPANHARPSGAGSPTGWSSGTYSYFGPSSYTPDVHFDVASIIFGFGQSAAIPLNAKYLKVGVRINYSQTPGAVVQISGMSLMDIKPPLLRTLTPSHGDTYSPGSQAAIASGHWPTQSNAVENGGASEINHAKALQKTQGYHE